MPARREGATSILGPCPGCGSWQLDYTDAVAIEFFDCPGGFHAVVEDALQEHFDACPQLREYLDGF
jgi:hypothetical protein